MNFLDKLNFFLFQKLWDRRLSWWNYIKQVFIIIIIILSALPFLIKGIFHYYPIDLYFLYKTWIVYRIIPIVSQSYLLINRANDANESPIKVVLVFLILYAVLYYFNMSEFSWIITILAVFIKKSDQSYFSRYTEVVSPQQLWEAISVNTIAQDSNIWIISQPIPVVYNNTINTPSTNQDSIIQNKWNNSQLFWSLLRWFSIWIILVFISITLWYYVFYNYLWQTIWIIVTIIISYWSLIYAYNICKKAILIQSSQLNIDGFWISKKFFWMVIFPSFLQVIGLVWFILWFWEGYVISIICAIIIFVVGIIHNMLLWSRAWLYWLSLFQLDNPDNITKLPYFVRNKLITIKTKESTVAYHIIIPIVIFAVMFILWILAVNGVFW